MRTRANPPHPPPSRPRRLRASCRLSYHVCLLLLYPHTRPMLQLKLCSVPRVQDLHDPQREKAEKRAPQDAGAGSSVHGCSGQREQRPGLSFRVNFRESVSRSRPPCTMHMRLGSALISPALCPAHQSALPTRPQLAHAASGPRLCASAQGAGGA